MMSLQSVLKGALVASNAHEELTDVGIGWVGRDGGGRGESQAVMWHPGGPWSSGWQSGPPVGCC